MNTDWVILDRSGELVDPATFPRRPDDARELENDNEYTPWHRLDEHIHINNGKIDGIHARGDANTVKHVLNHCLQHEDKIINHFGSKEDNVILIDVLKYIAATS